MAPSGNQNLVVWSKVRISGANSKFIGENENSIHYFCGVVKTNSYSFLILKLCSLEPTRFWSDLEQLNYG